MSLPSKVLVRQVAPALAVALMTTACAVGPDFHRPAPPQAASFTPSPAPAPATPDAQRIQVGAPIPPRWWTLFGSPALDSLVKESVAHNPDTAAAEAALRQARELLYAQRAAYLPSASGSFQASRQRSSQTLAPPLASNATEFSLYTAQVEVSYTLDVFGGVRRQVEAARARAESQAFETRAAYLTLTANVVETAMQEASLREQIAATRQVIEVETKLLQVMRKQHDVGQISGADVAAQETALALAQQTLPPLEKQLTQERDLLAILTGRRPDQGPYGTIELSQLTVPRAIPVGLPSAIVEQRPDVRAAEANLHAASAMVGVATAARLPNFTLTASGGGASEKLSQLTASPNLFWNLAGGVVQPLFDAGALKHQQRAAVAAYDQAREQYRSTVLHAFQNAADSIQALQLDDEALAAAEAADKAATRSLQIAGKQVQLGETSAVTLLNAEQAYHQAEVALVQARTARFADTAALFQSLGVGEW